MLQLLGINKIAAYAIGGALLIGVVGTTYYVWKRGVESAALMEYNQRQLEQNARDQSEFMRRQEELAEQQRAAARELAEQNRRLQSRVNSINQMLNQAEDSPAPDVIRRTIESLREGSPR